LPVKRLFILLFCLALGAGAGAQVYRVVDEDGNVTFTDRPPSEDAEPVEVRTPNTTPPPPGNAFPEPPPPPEDEPVPGYSVTITAPADETIIPRGPGNVSVSASVSPALQSGHLLQLLMNGEPREEPQTGGSWDLTNVFRGEQNISVAVVDGDGKRLSESDPVTIFVFRPSTNDRNRRPRPTPLNRGN
jgi:hypothetical protein